MDRYFDLHLYLAIGGRASDDPAAETLVDLSRLDCFCRRGMGPDRRRRQSDLDICRDDLSRMSTLGRGPAGLRRWRLFGPSAFET